MTWCLACDTVFAPASDTCPECGERDPDSPPADREETDPARMVRGLPDD